MYIEEVIIDGFKSYATRTVISGFDPRFNAITGLNGSGKSNILDAICFVLGISNLTHVRASNLQELVYKQGQAGISKASVTIVFNNTERNTSPVGYEAYDQISVSRQVIIGGRNKYLINGHTAQVSQVHNLFHSVQLNVNNPHFLIMQGRITKVLNMKPPEILAMIEEAAGTRMYENKKQAALATMEKKNKKVLEINRVLAEEITPTLEKLRTEMAHYLKWSANQAEIERLERFCIAFKYYHAKETVETASGELQELKDRILDQTSSITNCEAQINEIEEELKELKQQKDAEMNGDFQLLKEKEEMISKQLVKLKSMLSNKQKLYMQEQETLQGLMVQGKENQQSKQDQQLKLEQKQQVMNELQAVADQDATALKQIQQELTTLETGMQADTETKNVSMNEALSAKQKQMYDTKSLIQTTEMTLKHSKKQLEQLKSQRQRLSKEQERYAAVSKALKQAEEKLSRLEFNPSEFEQISTERDQLEQQLQRLGEKYDDLNAQVAGRLRFDYSIPKDKNFRPDNVKGLIAKLIKIKDSSHAVALEVAAGGKLYHVVVETEETGKKILKQGRLQRRVTFVPLNRIQHRTIANDKVQKARSIGRSAVRTALSCVEYDENVSPAIEYAFGSAFVCDSIDVAKQVTFHKDIRMKSVTLDGDSFDPAGTLQGGSSSPVGSILLKVQDLMAITQEMEVCQSQLDRLTRVYQELQKKQTMFTELTQEKELKRCELDLFQNGPLVQVENEIETIETNVNASDSQLKELQRTLQSIETECQRLSKTMEQMNSSRADETKRLTKEITKQKKISGKSTEKVKTFSQDMIAVHRELEQCDLDQKTIDEQVKGSEKVQVELNSQVEALQQEHEALENELKAISTELDEKRSKFADSDAVRKELMKKRETIQSKIKKIQVAIKKDQHKVTRFDKDQSSAQEAMEGLLSEHAWIQNEQEFFGQPHTDYCFVSRDPKEAQVNLGQLRQEQGILSKKINKKVMGMIEKAESEYKGLMTKKQIIENDKTKIQSVIKELDMKKNEAVEKTWQKVTKDFGMIFSTLLPGTTAKLQPVDPDRILDGLQVKVAFGSVWKESLTELSGGQRSLLALSLILALLLFKPAPMYILDEVDAALDLSHTQNIGQMIKRHFSHSQFIVVSLKEGMFNNANVVFRTKFVDGVSTVTRTTC